jgi:hypothetical protein
MTDPQHSKIHFDKTNPRHNQIHPRFQLIMRGYMPLMTVSMATMTVLHSVEDVHIPHE